MQQPARQSGFTLLELMIAVAILAILLSLAVPSFTEMIRNNRTAAQTNQLVSALNAGRSEASKQGLPVSVCTITTAAATTCATGTSNWARGWMVFTDPDGGTAGQVDTGEQILLRFPPAPTQISVTSNSLAFLRFRADGSLTNTAAATVELQHTGCSGKQRRRVSLTPSGSIRMEKIDCT